MEFSKDCTQRRYCAEGEELLRAVVSIPTVPQDEPFRVISELCREINDRSLLFAEKTLFPSIRAEYEMLSPHDRKFAIPRRVYRVEITAETASDETYGEAIRMVLSVTLRRRGRTEFHTEEIRLWAKDKKQNAFFMVDTERNGKCYRKTQKNIHFVHK